MDTKKLFLEIEGDNYYNRNKEALNKEISSEIQFYSSFLSTCDINMDENTKIVEIGAANGRNLNYLHKKFGCNVSGIEPSSDAVIDGNTKFFNGKDVLLKGTSDDLPYDDESIDIVMFGFSLFWVGRNYLFRSVAEADRILKPGGYLLLTDFDTINYYKRVNVHNKDAFTYKMNYANLFLANPQYFLVEKKSFSHSDLVFNADIQERVSAQILYKDFEENVYILD